MLCPSKCEAIILLEIKVDFSSGKAFLQIPNLPLCAGSNDAIIYAAKQDKG